MDVALDPVKNHAFSPMTLPITHDWVLWHINDIFHNDIHQNVLMTQAPDIACSTFVLLLQREMMLPRCVHFAKH